MAGHIYLIGCQKFHWYKIGKSNDASIRVTELGILLPFRIEVIAVWKVANHHEAERLLHEQFAQKRINGEWFNLSYADMRKMMVDMADAQVNIAIGFKNVPDEPRYGTQLLRRIAELTKKNATLQEQVIALTRENAELREIPKINS